MNKNIPNQDKDDDEVWGNIELPGVPDEVLYSTNWNLVAANRARSEDPVWREKNKEAMRRRAKDPSYASKALRILKKRNTDAELEKVRIEAIRKVTATDEWKKAQRLGAQKAFCKRIQTPLGIFPSQGDAASAHGVTVQSLWTWMKKFPDQYYYLPKEQRDD